MTWRNGAGDGGAGAKIVLPLMEKAKARNVKIHLPVDFVTGTKARPHRR